MTPAEHWKLLRANIVSQTYQLLNLFMDTPALAKVLLQLQRRWGPLFQAQVSNVVAYGSAVLPQTFDSRLTASNTLDLLVEVRNPSIFHHELARVSPSDYAGAAWLLGPSVLDLTTTSLFPMHSNFVDLGNRRVKYSVVGKSYLRTDLLSWKYLSFAGRLQKAVVPLQSYQEGL